MYRYFGVLGNRSSPCHLSNNDSTLVEKDEGISDDDDPAELKVLLDLSEQVKNHKIYSQISLSRLRTLFTEFTTLLL